MSTNNSKSLEMPLREGDVIGLFGTVHSIENGTVMVHFEDAQHGKEDVVPFDASTLRLVRRITKVGDIVLNPQGDRVIVHNISNGNMAHVTKEDADMEETSSYQTYRIGQLEHIGQVSEADYGKQVFVPKAETAHAEAPKANLIEPAKEDPAPSEGASAAESDENIFDLKAAEFKAEETPSAAEERPALPLRETPATESMPAAETPEKPSAPTFAVPPAQAAEPAAVEAPKPTSEAETMKVSPEEHRSEQEAAASAIANIRESRGNLFEKTDLSKIQRQPEEP